MTKPASVASTFRLGDLTVNRIGYGAMQLAGPGVFGPPQDKDEAVRVLREAVSRGVNHIDTSDFYGPHIVNHLICEALDPYPDDLVITTKVGAVRGKDGAWIAAMEPEQLIAQVHDNLTNLGLKRLNVVNLRAEGTDGPIDRSIADSFSALADLQRQGLIQHLGLSNVSLAQVEEARSIAEIVCVQNWYNLVRRHDDALIDFLAEEGIAYVPFFPLGGGGYSSIQSNSLTQIAAELGCSVPQVALAWLLRRAPNILLIAGTARLNELLENLVVADFALSTDITERLTELGKLPPS